MGVMALIWVFWLWALDSARMEDGWVVVPTQGVCETAREAVADMAARSGVRIGVSRCQEMTVGELERKRHERPSDLDLPPLIPSF